MALGYSLTGYNNEQCLFLLYGTGANGKSTLLELVRWLLGDYGHNIAFRALESNARWGSSATPELAALNGKRFVSTAETTEGSRFNEGLIKSLTGGDRQQARFLHENPIEYDPTAKLWIAVNHKPVVMDDSEGFWRRVRLVPFTQRFQGNKADRDLLLTLKGEAEGILAWMVRGAVAWYADGLTLPDEVRAATERYREESDPLMDFIDEKCITEGKHVVRARDLYNAYKTWFMSNGMAERERLTETGFGRRLSERFEKRKVDGYNTYFGIGLRAHASEGWS